MSEGWFKIHRSLFKKAIWLNSTSEQKVILITLLGMANHEGREWEWKGKQFKTESGQFVTSANSIIDKAGIGISRQNVRTALTKFKKYDFLTFESTKTGIFISIVNWGLYQGEKNVTNQAINQKLTMNSPSYNQPLTTNKNDKNNKNEKKFIYISEFTENNLLRQTILDFMKMRAEIRKPMTDRALQLMLTKLKSLSNDEEVQIKILENSIENCWQGVFPLRDYGKGRFASNDYKQGRFKGNNQGLLSGEKQDQNAFKVKNYRRGMLREKGYTQEIFQANEHNQYDKGIFLGNNYSNHNHEKASGKDIDQKMLQGNEHNNVIFLEREYSEGATSENEYHKKVLQGRERKNGGFGQNYGASEKKFNIKIPRWEPKADKEYARGESRTGTFSEDEPF